MAERSREAGFGLIEVLVCTALLMLGSVFALALVPAVVHRAQAHVMREAALGTARNALERVRAATAYVPPEALSDASTRATATATHAWALHPSAAYASSVRFARALCGRTGSITDVPLDVALTYDAGSDTVRVTVAYPPDPCVPERRVTLALAAELAPAALAPQTRMPATIADPDTQ